MKKEYVIESCVDSITSSIRAQANGADQIELCARLDLDGLTPDIDIIQQAMEQLDIGVKVMIRPRGGNFVYTPSEILEMKDSIAESIKLNVDGIVLGVLNKDENALDIEAIADLAAAAYPLPVTVHKAIDLCTDPISDIHKLKAIPNVKAILTSGTAATAALGQNMLISMIEAAGDEITIIAAGKITESNLSTLHAAIRGQAYHGKLIV